MYQSNLPRVSVAMSQAVDAGLKAAAAVLEDEVKRDLKDGFTSGRFTSGESERSVDHSAPDANTQGRFILVGTDEIHNIFWELGGYNAYTRQFERQEVWMPAALRTQKQQLAAFTPAAQAAFQEKGR